MDAGKTIRMLRTAAGLNQKEFAARLRISASALSLYESGEREPPLSFLKAVSRELRIPVSVLLAESGEAPSGLTPEQAEDHARVQELLARVLTALAMERLKFHDIQEPTHTS
jgi:transcriptional regulator with XRE-family HTH domain